MEQKNLSLGEHLEDLRKLLTISLLTIVLLSVISYTAFGEQLLQLIMKPLQKMDVNLVYIGMTEAFLTKIKLSVLAGVVLAMPVIILQLWSFIKPALFPGERKFIIILLPLSLLMFAGGVVFAYMGI